MKWDVKHDRAKKVLNHFLDNAGYWTEVENLTDGLTEEEIREVNEEIQAGRYASCKSSRRGKASGRSEGRGAGG